MDRHENRTETVTQTEEPAQEDATVGGTEFALDGEISDYFGRSAEWQWWAAAILALPAVPILLIAMALVRLTSRGPAIYRQTRVGLNGKHFQLIKVRTMKVDAEVGTGAVWTTSLRDPRITLVGRVLRWTHIDELPQLWNVLRGEMALVGPRPERPEFTGMLAESIPGYLDRLAVRPGVTGLAQVNLPADSDEESVRKKLVLDLQYIREGCLSLDLRLILCTVGRVVGFRFAWFRRWLDVSRSVESALQESSVNKAASTPVANRVATNFPCCDSGENGGELYAASREVAGPYYRQLAEPSRTTHHS